LIEIGRLSTFDRQNAGVDERTVRSVAVLGLGLIGGSLARRLAAAYDVISYDADPATREAARVAGLSTAESIVDTVRGRDLIVLAVPLPAYEGVLPVLAEVAGGAVVTDVASVKAEPLAAARKVLEPAGIRYVGGHPMAGTERSGFGASDPRLFDGAAWVLCVEDDTDLAAWLAVTGMVTGFGCRVVPCAAAAHDLAVARVSGLPHLLALALSTAGAAGGPLALALAAGSFRDGTRVAGARTDLFGTLLDGNRDALAAVTDEVLAALTEARDALRSGGTTAPLVAAGRAARKQWAGTGIGGRPSTVDIGQPEGRAALSALADAGGHVVGRTGSVLDCWLPPVAG
jgi:prephenate dehydrogenase